LLEIGRDADLSRTFLDNVTRPTPTHSSWLNQIEILFSILTGKSLDGASLHSVPELIAHVDALIASYNETARPFVWTKSKVHQNASNCVSRTSDSSY
jgi:hypothetical protein